MNERKKASIAEEYLNGKLSIRKLGAKYGIDFRTLHKWVQKYRGKHVKEVIVTPIQAPEPPAKPEEVLPTDVKALQEALRISKLQVELLNTIIDIAEEQLNIDIRKKSGTKR
jgi:transposase-like protein